MFLMGESYPKYGQVFTVPVLHKRITFLLGPEVTTHFFRVRAHRDFVSGARGRCRRRTGSRQAATGPSVAALGAGRDGANLRCFGCSTSEALATARPCDRITRRSAAVPM